MTYVELKLPLSGPHHLLQLPRYTVSLLDRFCLKETMKHYVKALMLVLNKHTLYQDEDH